MKTSDFDFHLPDELIAKSPLSERDASRLLLLPKAGGEVEHRAFRELPAFLAPGDLLILNDAKVIPARLKGTKADSGGRVELLLCDPLPPEGGRAAWRCMGGSSKPLRPGRYLRFEGEGGELLAEILATHEGGFVDVAFQADPDAFFDRLERLGELPLPPYLGRPPEEADKERYQTIYARERGAVAAPTAGLHFTDAIFAGLEERGVERAAVTLHVGPGTFMPVRAEEVEAHRMHAERYHVPEATAQAIAQAKARGGRVIAVGTTALRTLESAADGTGGVRAGAGVSELFVKPGYEFRVVDGLVTNFHLPRSTLVMLVAALTGHQRLLAAYAEAVQERYRFYSYGDAMLVI